MKQKPTLHHFTNVQFTISPKPESSLILSPFRYNQAAEVTTVHGITILNDVAAQVAKACNQLTVQSNVFALVELCALCQYYDKKNKINWQSTISLIKQTLIRLNFTSPFINQFSALLQTELEAGKSVSK